MAKQKRKSNGFQGKGASKHVTAKKAAKKKMVTSRFLTVGVVVIVLGLITAGMVGVFNLSSQDGMAHASNIQLNTAGAEVVSLAEGASLANVEQTITDRETRYLGPENNPEGLSLAEAGQFDGPTLVWFHADWCHVCQRIKPEVVDLGEAYHDQINFVKINIGKSDGNRAGSRYGVRATPTFVLLDDEGEVLANAPGWPTYQGLVNAFDQLLGRG